MGKRGKRKIERIDESLIGEKFVRDYEFSPLQKKAIELVFKLKAARLGQIARILGYHPHYVRNEMHKLYYNRFLDRRFPWEEKVQKYNNLGSVQGVYFLDDAGKIAITGLLDIETRDVKWRPVENLIKYEKLKHTLECSEILARVQEECRKIEFNYNIIDYMCEKFLWKKFSYQGGQYEFCPDLYIKILKDRYAYSFFVENDEATMDVNTFLSKIPKYDNYKLSGIYENEYRIFPRVLVITTSKDRAVTLAKEVNKKQKSKVEFLFTWKDMFYEMPFGSNTFIHTSIEKIPKTYSLFEEIPEEAKIGLLEKEEKTGN